MIGPSGQCNLVPVPGEHLAHCKEAKFGAMVRGVTYREG